MKNVIDEEFEALDQEFYRLHSELLCDLRTFRRECSHPTSQTHRRAYIRALFSMIDALTHCLKRDSLYLAEGEGLSLTDKERRVLKGEFLKRDQSGQVKTVDAFLSISQGIRVTFSFYAYMNYVDYTIDEESEGWESLIKAVKIRNRITHPKKHEDLEISDEELKRIDSAGNWFIHTMADVYRMSATSLFRYANALEAAGQNLSNSS